MWNVKSRVKERTRERERDTHTTKENKDRESAKAIIIAFHMAYMVEKFAWLKLSARVSNNFTASNFYQFNVSLLASWPLLIYFICRYFCLFLLQSAFATFWNFMSVPFTSKPYQLNRANYFLIALKIDFNETSVDYSAWLSHWNGNRCDWHRKQFIWFDRRSTQHTNYYYHAVRFLGNSTYLTHTNWLW